MQHDHGLYNGDLGDFRFSYNLRDLISIRFPQHHGTVNLISGTVNSFFGFCLPLFSCHDVDDKRGGGEKVR